MWNPDGPLIQAELGSGLVSAITPPDNRGLFDKLFGSAGSPAEGQVILDYTRQAREYLAQNEGLALPHVAYTDNDQLQANEVIIHFGLERRRFAVQHPNHVVDFLVNKVREYSSVPLQRGEMSQTLASCIEDVKHDQYQFAFEKYIRVYYHSVLQGYDYEATRCLAELGNIWLKNGDSVYAGALFKRALALSSSPSIADAGLKSQVGLDGANAFRVLRQVADAHQCYATAFNIAYHSGHSSYVYLALIGLAEITYGLGQFPNAIGCLNQAKQIVLSSGGSDRFQLAFHLQESILQVLYQIEARRSSAAPPQQTTPELLHPLFEQIKRVTIDALVQSVVGSVIYKLFGVGAVGLSLISIFGSSDFKFNQPIFNAPSVIGHHGQMTIS